MNRSAAMPFALQVLDDGMRVYRQHFGRFVLVASIIFVPFLLAAFLALGAVSAEWGDNWVLLAFGLLVLLAYPLLLYVIAALSRMAAALFDGQTLSLRTALSIGPMRGCGMLGWSMLFSIASSMALGIVTGAGQCTVFVMFAAVGTVIEELETGLIGAAAIGGLLSFVTLAWIVIASIGQGMLLHSMAYTLQPLAIEGRSWGASVSRSIDALFYRFWRNLIVFGGASIVLVGFGASVISTLAAAFQLIATVLLPTNIGESNVVFAVFILVVGMATLVVCLPAVPIWMTLLYRRVTAERDGSDLEQRIAAMSRL